MVAIYGGTLVVNRFDVRRDAARVRRSIGLAGQYPARKFTRVRAYYDPTKFPQPAPR